MSGKSDPFDPTVKRRGFLTWLLKASGIALGGAALLSGACKCGDEDVHWSDEDEEGDTPAEKKPPAPEPPPEGEDE